MSNGGWCFRVGFALAPLALSCAAVLGIDELPVAADGGAPSHQLPPEEVQPADACGSPDASFCARSCPRYDFCDDFEGETLAFERWKSPGIVPKPIKTRTFGASVALVDRGGERGLVLLAEAQTQDNTPQTVAFLSGLAASSDAATARGVHARLKTRLERLEFVPDADTSRRVALLGLGAASFPFPLATVSFIAVGDRAFALSIEQATVDGSAGETELARVDGLPRDLLAGDFAAVELAAGARSVLAANALDCDLADADADAAAGAAPDSLVVFARAGAYRGCGALIGDLASADWLTNPVLFTGVGVTDYGHAEFSFDDVAVRYLR